MPSASVASYCNLLGRSRLLFTCSVEVPAGLELVLERMLARDSARCYPTPDQVCNKPKRKRSLQGRDE